MEKTKIVIDPTNAYEKTYALRFAGRNNKTIEISVPKILLRREARRLDLTLEQAVQKLEGLWLFNNFDGCSALLQLKLREDKEGSKT